MAASLPASLADLNKAAVAAAKAGQHEEALQIYNQLFQKLTERHLSHPELFITHSNKAASHLALGQYTQALQEAKQCMELLTSAAVSAGLLSPSRHPHWPKACQRLGQAFAGLGQHQQAAATFEAGLAADPLNTALKSGLQQAQQGLAHSLLSGKTLAHIKALPAPATPERITLVPHNAQGLRSSSSALNPSSARGQRRGHQVGWQGGSNAAAALLDAADRLTHAVTAAADGDLSLVLSSSVATSGAYRFDAGCWQLPKQLLTPAAADADVGLRDVYEYVNTQCAIRAPKQYIHRTLPDAARMSSWWAAVTAAVAAVQEQGRAPRVLLLGAKAGVLAVAALRAGAQHVTCVESCPYLAAACKQVLQDNSFPPTSYSTICTPSPSTLKLGAKEGADVPNVCNCLVADVLDDGVLSAGLIPAVSHALEELLVRDDPVLVPRKLTVMAQAVGVRPSVVDIKGLSGSSTAGAGGAGGSTEGAPGAAEASGSRSWRLDLTALDQYRWTPSQALPSPLDPDMLIPLSDPQQVWHLPLVDVEADKTAVQQLDMELTAAGAWCAVAFWAEVHLFGDITYSTAGPWNVKVTPATTAATCQLDSTNNGSRVSTSSSSSDPGQRPRSSSPVSSSSTCSSFDTYPSTPHKRVSRTGSCDSIGDTHTSWDGAGGFACDLSGSLGTFPTGPAPSIMHTPGPGSASSPPGLEGTTTTGCSPSSTLSSNTSRSGAAPSTQYPTRPALSLLLTYPEAATAAAAAAPVAAVSSSTTGNQTCTPAAIKLLQCSCPSSCEASIGLVVGVREPPHKGQPSGHEVPGFMAPPSYQPALCWLPGALPVSCGDIYPLVASHNTVRCMFAIKEVDYSFLFHQEPSFPHNHFAMVADKPRLTAYAAALRRAVARAAAKRQAPQAAEAAREAHEVCVSGGSSKLPVGLAGGSNFSKSLPGCSLLGHTSCHDHMSTAAAGPANITEPLQQQQRQPITILDVGCGSGVLSLLAAAALCNSTQPAGEAGTEFTILASAATRASGNQFCPTMPHQEAMHQAGATETTAVTPAVPAATAAAGTTSLSGSVVGVELTGPLAAVAQRVVAANGAAGLVSVVQADAASCRRGQQVPLGGADIIVLDVFDAGLVGHGVLGLVEVAKSALAAEGVQLIPASATLYCMGIEVLTVSSWELQRRSVQGDQQQQDEQSPAAAAAPAGRVEVNLQALQAYKWSDEPDTVQLHHLPHKCLTSAVKLADFDLCAPAGSPYPKEMQAQLQVLAAGQLNGLLVWFDLHLAEGVSVTSAPVGFTTGGRPCDKTPQLQQPHYWGQALHFLDATADVQPGDDLNVVADRSGFRLTFGLLEATRSYSSTPGPAAGSSHEDAPKPQQEHHPGNRQHQKAPSNTQGSNSLQAAEATVVPVYPALRPPWLRAGAGIEDPAVWSVKKCQQLLGQMLMRAPGAKFPPIWKDLALMQVHAGSLGLCAATVGAVTQELAMREALSVASQKQLVVSPFAVAEAAGTQPPVVWR